MRLIDKDVLIKAIDEGFVMTSEDIEGMTEIKAIPTDWLRKELIECLYDGVSSEDGLPIYHDRDRRVKTIATQVTSRLVHRRI